MLSEQERMNNAFKEALSHEEMMAKKFAQLASEITEPQQQQMLRGMEQACRNNCSTLSAKMTDMGIV